MLTFRNLNVYDVADPDESLVEALREYPELREFEDALIEDEEVATLLKEGPREIPEGFVRERLEAQGFETKPKASTFRNPCWDYEGYEDWLAKQPKAVRDAADPKDLPPKAVKKAKKPKASKKTKEPKVPYLLTAEGSKAMVEIIAKAEGLSQYLQAKGLQEKPREESPKGIWDKLDLL